MSTVATISHFPKITFNRYRKLIAYFSDVENLWQGELCDFIKAGIEENVAQEFIEWRQQTPTEKIMERMEKEGVKTVSWGESGYPKLLAEINDPPLTIFYRGKLALDAFPTIAFVGTRNHTNYGRLACQDLVAPLAKQGMVIVSGLALGLDGIAHQTTLDSNGQTLAVLGSGIDNQHIYPAAHRYLAQKIIATGGAILSEYPPGFLPTQYSFPARNRIIAGLCLGTVIIEAPAESGALITAKCALDYNREVFAVPHPINSVAGEGANNIIKMGAKLVTNANDITDALNLRNLTNIIDNRRVLPGSPTEKIILDTLSREPKHIDIIIKETGLDSPKVNGTLTLMEMRGMVRNVGGMNYVEC